MTENLHAACEFGGFLWCLVKLYQIEKKLQTKVERLTDRVTELERRSSFVPIIQLK